MDVATTLRARWRRFRRGPVAVHAHAFARTRDEAAVVYAQLAALLVHAAESVPFHAERMARAGFDPRGPAAPLRLRELPVLTRAELRDRGAALVSARFAGDELVPHGAVGQWAPALAQEEAAAQVARARAGWPAGGRVARIAGPDVPGFRARDLAALAARLRARRPRVLGGDPRALDLLARHLLWHGDRLPVPLVELAAAEATRTRREEARRAFGGEVRAVLESAECGLLAVECPRGALHANRRAVVLETHDDGRLLATSLLYRATPLLRCETGFSGLVADGPCPCGDRRPMIWDVVPARA